MTLTKYRLPHHTVTWTKSDYLKADINEKIDSIHFHEYKINAEVRHIDNRRADIKKLLTKLGKVNKETVQQ